MSPWNQYFDQLENEPEQWLHSDLYEESIEVRGDTMEYLPRRLKSYDSLLGEDAASYFDVARSIPVYLENYDGFRGDQTFLSKFGLEIRDQLVISISRAAFDREIGTPEGFSRPREGDLLYFSKNKKCFEIKNVNYLKPFYPLGALPEYSLTCELYEYSSERFMTGIVDIDNIQPKLSLDVLSRALRDESGKVITDESGIPIVMEDAGLDISDPVADNDTIETIADTELDFSEDDPFNELSGV